MQRFLIVFTLVLLIITLVWFYILTGKTEGDERADSDTAPTASWTWKNPYTFKQAVIPAGWSRIKTGQFQDAVLALQHETGKSLIYIIYDKPVNQMTLEEYIDAVKPMNQKEYGITEFTAATDKSGKEIYEAEGGKYMGDNLVGIDIRIWSDGSDSFWESVETTDMEYKNLEYNAKELVTALAETTY